MKRIYLDSNVFRILKKDTSKDSLFNKLINAKDRLVFLYSSAHLLDLQEDKTDYKFQDLKFMENLVDNNYLILKHKDKFSNLLLATPTIAFETIGSGYSLDSNIFDFENLLDIEGIAETPEIKLAKENLAKALNIPLKLNLKSNIESHQKGDIEAWKKLLPEIKDEYTIKEWLQVFSKMYSNLLETNTYKELRKNSLDTLQLTTKFDIDIEKFSFDEDLRSTPLKKSFLELVEQSMSFNKAAQEQYEYMFFITAYNLLNILGIDKEKNKKAIFVNTINDAQHAYYGAHSDFLVSDDEGFILKSKVLYKLLGIETVTKNFIEFEKELYIIQGVSDNDLNSYLEFLTFELQNSLIIDSNFDIELGSNYVTYKTENYHFGYFNRFDVYNLNQEYHQYIFYKDIRNYSRFILYKEYEEITNKISSIFQMDNNGRKNFTDIDLAEINENKWKGRQWQMNSTSFILKKNISVGEIHFVIQIKKY